MQLECRQGAILRVAMATVRIRDKRCNSIEVSIGRAFAGRSFDVIVAGRADRAGPRHGVPLAPRALSVRPDPRVLAPRPGRPFREACLASQEVEAPSAGEGGRSPHYGCLGPGVFPRENLQLRVRSTPFPRAPSCPS
ncbi:Hypothetical protein NTJ_00758 [Nesidiocoris tenuis]|uniref:Uncharacterized protein n=1 Tax=Nesidiocoris tenuis TaxID=355587 RepID=A0ABN7A6T0_9HEMI|nr:Hypothetical protein NTJ_00758 [Nesidiocoris tenuis]